MYDTREMIRQTNFRDSNRVFEDSNNNIFNCHKTQTDTNYLHCQKQNNELSCISNIVGYTLSIGINMLIPCINNGLLFKYTSNSDMNNNKFINCGAIFGEIYLRQILYADNLLFNSSILIYSIMLILYDMNKSNLNTLITKDDTKCTDKSRILSIGRILNDLGSLFIYSSESSFYGNGFISSKTGINSISNSIFKSLKLHDNITHLKNPAPIASLTINLFKITNISNTSLDISDLLIMSQYVIAIRNDYVINFNLMMDCFKGDNDNIISTGYFSNNKYGIQLLHHYYNHNKFVENLLNYISDSTNTCSDWQNIPLLQLTDTINMFIHNTSGDSSNYIVNSHASYVLNNISLSILEHEIISMYLGFDHSANDVVDYIERLFLACTLCGSIENNIFQLSLSLYSTNKFDIHFYQNPRLVKFCYLKKDSD